MELQQLADAQSHANMRAAQAKDRVKSAMRELEVLQSQEMDMAKKVEMERKAAVDTRIVELHDWSVCVMLRAWAFLTV